MATTRRPRNGRELRNRPAEAAADVSATKDDSSPSGKPLATDTTHTDIARRAYEFYEQRGRVDGHDYDDWLSAERDLTPRLS